MKVFSEFNRVTFGLPIETFRVEAYIALEERLPVVTEFVLRLLKICGKVPLKAFRDYFGFTDNEALAVVESLLRQGLIEVFDDQAQLSAFALERFEEAGGEHPRFSKVELRQDTVTFDLISFTPLRFFGSGFPTDNIIKLSADDESLGQSVERAKGAYRQRYPEIASMKEDLREKSYGVYSIEHVESKRRNYTPAPVSFSLDQDGHVQRHIDETFEKIAPPELLHFVNEQVTANIPTTLSLGCPGLEEFIETFEVQVMKRYLTGKRFDLSGYLADVHVARSVKYPRGVDAVFGNLYLESNRERITARIMNRRTGRTKQGKLLTSMAWLVPDYTLWGRGETFAETVSAFSSQLRTEKSVDALYVFAYAEKDQEGVVTNLFRVQGLGELHFSRPLVPEGKLMAGRLELLLYPAGFVVAMCHVAVPGSSGLWAPVGFLSTLPKHLDIAHKLIRKAMTGRRYGRRARFSQNDSRPQPTSFEEGCSFLNYDSLTGPSYEVSAEEEEI